MQAALVSDPGLETVRKVENVVEGPGRIESVVQIDLCRGWLRDADVLGDGAVEQWFCCGRRRPPSVIPWDRSAGYRCRRSSRLRPGGGKAPIPASAGSTFRSRSVPTRRRLSRCDIEADAEEGRVLIGAVAQADIREADATSELPLDRRDRQSRIPFDRQLEQLIEIGEGTTHLLEAGAQEQEELNGESARQVRSMAMSSAPIVMVPAMAERAPTMSISIPDPIMTAWLKAWIRLVAAWAPA